MTSEPFLLLLLTLAVTCHAKYDIEVTPNCSDWEDSLICPSTMMRITLRFLYPLNMDQKTSSILLFDFEKRFGDETCNFYIGVKDEPVAFISMCTNGDGVNKFEGALYTSGASINYNEETSRHEWGWYGLDSPDHRSISVKKPGSFCKIIDDSLYEHEHQVPHVKRDQPSLSKDAVIEIAFVADYTFLDYYGSPAKVEKVIYQIKNGMRAMYQQLDIGIDVVDVFIFDERLTSDLIRDANYKADENAKKELKLADRFDRCKEYYEGISRLYLHNLTDLIAGGERVRISGVPDAIISFTTRPFDNIKDDDEVLLGFAGLGVLCNRGQAFILMPYWYDDPRSNTTLLASLVDTVTHEVGHLLGLPHQDNCSTGCKDEQMKSCIMHSISSHNSGNWSDCSKSQIRGDLHNPNLSPIETKECLFTRDAHSRNAPLFDHDEFPVRKTKPPTTTTTAPASSSDQSGTSDTSVTAPRRHGITISPRKAGISGKTWVIIAICVFVAVIVIAVLCMMFKRSRPPVSTSSGKLYHKLPEKTSKSIRPARSVSRQSSRNSQKSRRVASPERTGSHMSA